MKNFNKILRLLILLASGISSVSASQHTLNSCKIKRAFTAPTISEIAKNSLYEAYSKANAYKNYAIFSINKNNPLVLYKSLIQAIPMDDSLSLQTSTCLTSNKFLTLTKATNLPAGNRMATLMKIAANSAMGSIARTKGIDKTIEFADQQSPETASFLRRIAKFFGLQK